MHPETAHIFRFWQIYLDNVNPILKVTHAHTLQKQIIEASANLNQATPGLEALLFSIYCAAVMSIGDEECLAIFGERREMLRLKYQSCCQQALANANFLRSADMQVLVALFLCLVGYPSQRPASYITYATSNRLYSSRPAK